MIEDIARKSLTAGPCEGPKWRRQADSFEFFLGLLPKIVGLVRKMQPDFGHMRRCDQRSVGEDEIFGVLERKGHRDDISATRRLTAPGRDRPYGKPLSILPV